jgi:hypothetical protein
MALRVRYLISFDKKSDVPRSWRSCPVWCPRALVSKFPCLKGYETGNSGVEILIGEELLQPLDAGIGSFDALGRDQTFEAQCLDVFADSTLLKLSCLGQVELLLKNRGAIAIGSEVNNPQSLVLRFAFWRAPILPREYTAEARGEP